MNTYERFLLALDVLRRERDIDATLREVAQVMGIWPSHAAYLRNKLAARGMVKYHRNTGRTLRLTDAGQEWVQVRMGRKRIA